MKLKIFTAGLDGKVIDVEVKTNQNSTKLELAQNITKFGYFDDITNTYIPGHSIRKIQIIEE